MTTAYSRKTDPLSPADEPLIRRDFEALMKIHEEREDAKLLDFAKAAFPKGDTPEGLQGHYEFHSARINAAMAQEQAEKARRKMYEAVQAKVLEQGVAGAFGLVRIIVIAGFCILLIKFGITLPSWIKF